MINIPVAKPKHGVTLEDYGITLPARIRELIAYTCCCRKKRYGAGWSMAKAHGSAAMASIPPAPITCGTCRVWSPSSSVAR